MKTLDQNWITHTFSSKRSSRLADCSMIACTSLFFSFRAKLGRCRLSCPSGQRNVSVHNNGTWYLVGTTRAIYYSIHLPVILLFNSSTSFISSSRLPCKCNACIHAFNHHIMSVRYPPCTMHEHAECNNNGAYAWFSGGLLGRARIKTFNGKGDAANYNHVAFFCCLTWNT